MIKRIFNFLILLIISLLLIPNKTSALSTGYKSIKDESITINDDNSSVQFSKVSFKNLSDSEYPAFGLAGLVYNGNNYEISFISTAKYYDLNYNLIATTYSNQFVPAGEYNSYSQISDLEEIKDGYTANDIAYYNLDIEINKLDMPTTNNNSQYNNYDYILNSYDINIIVNENNTLQITEKIGAYFYIDKHGIFRKIPLKNTVTRLDGTTSKNRAKISDITVNDNYSLYNENGYKVIKIGDPNYTMTGQKNYTISYLYNLGKDTGKEYDELYFNLIGDEWDTSINNITFTITMPKEFDKSKLGFSSGPTGTTDSSNVVYNVNGNTITGNLRGKLNPEEALTIRLELPEGYFVGASNNLDLMMLISIILPISFVVIAYIIWRKYGKDDQVIETVEFYPPQGFNSLEVGFLYKGKAENQDVTSLLVYLANKGYIKISEFEEKKLFSKSQGFKITKLKEYDGNDINEYVFLDGLFDKKTTSSLLNKDNINNNDNDNEVTSTDLYDNFYITMDKILSNINSKENTRKIFEKSASNKIIIIVLMIVATYCLITVPPIFTYGDPSSLLFALLFPGIGFSVMFTMLFGATKTIYINGKATHSAIGTKLFGLIWGGMFGGIPWALMVLPALIQDYIYFILYIIGILCVIGLITCLKYLPKRTPYGNEILGKLKGFKNFLETAEKDNLEAMVMKEPSYFYNILPYTYVLGISDKWIKKFETISLQAPSWYDGSTDFDIASFGTFMKNTMTSANQSMSSNPSSSSGGSSGGGSSGGGSGGGGGGSW